MGAWGEGPFENDDAGDWAWEFDGLDRAAGRQMLDAALGAVNGTEYVEAPDGAVAVAAAQVVAWMLSPGDIPDSPYGESAVAWIRSAGGLPDPALVASARQALQRVQAAGSELAELWDETGGGWRGDLQRLDHALISPP
jgi:hypothetical protein